MNLLIDEADVTNVEDKAKEIIKIANRIAQLCEKTDKKFDYDSDPIDLREIIGPMLDIRNSCADIINSAEEIEEQVDDLEDAPDNDLQRVHTTSIEWQASDFNDSTFMETVHEALFRGRTIEQLTKCIEAAI